MDIRRNRGDGIKMMTYCNKCGAMCSDHEDNHLRTNLCRKCYLEENKYIKEGRNKNGEKILR